MTLDDEDIEQIARRVAEVMAATGGRADPRYVDAADLARILGVDRDWVYANARRLGAVRLSEPNGRLRFDLRQVDQALAGPRPEVRRARRPRSRRRATQPTTAVIDYERC